MLLSNGTLVTASATENDELLWALKGGGPFYGLVLEWTLKVNQAPKVVTTLTYSWNNADAGTAAKVRRQPGQLVQLAVTVRLRRLRELGAAGPWPWVHALTRAAVIAAASPHPRLACCCRCWTPGTSGRPGPWTPSMR